MTYAQRDIQVYIAGPLSGGPTLTHVNRSIVVATQFAEAHPRIRPFVPHLYSLWHMVRPQQRGFWLGMDFGHLRDSEAIVRLRGDSSGSDLEVQLAEELAIPRYFESPECSVEQIIDLLIADIERFEV